MRLETSWQAVQYDPSHTDLKDDDFVKDNEFLKLIINNFGRFLSRVYTVNQQRKTQLYMQFVSGREFVLALVLVEKQYLSY